MPGTPPDTLSDKPSRLTIGTRGSDLALAQANLVAARLRAVHPDLAAPDAIGITVIKTTGDLVQDRPLAEIGGKGLFTKEIEEALLDGRIDLAVHSMKDLETHLPEGLLIAATLEREDPRDVLLAKSATSISDLPEGAVVGTASLRRGAQILAARPDLKVVPFRGNVNTRIAKLEAGEVDATILALAGLRRLGMTEYEARAIPVAEMLPAVAQGAIGLECRADDETTRACLAALEHLPTARAVAAERALLAALDGSCRTPIAALATLAGAALSLEALIAMPDGSVLHRDRRDGRTQDAEAIGAAAGAALRALGGPGFFDTDD
ncbi:MAG TPA: hydroxymethylbilane synthase [Alphaproteobacteria bacterium]|nr:hydroxymethylbilane synthase [Alphaproteobacteria bacterium]